MVRFIRLFSMGATVSYLVIGVGSSGRFDPMVFAGCLAIGVSFHVFADVGNDLADLPLDSTDPRRGRSPLVRGTVRPVTGLFVVFAQLPVLIALMAALHGSAPSRAALAAALVLLTLYNVWGKSIPIPAVADAVQGLGWAALVMLGAELAGGATRATYLAMGYVTIYVAFVNGVHGAVRDLRNDRAHGVLTTALMLGADLEDRSLRLPGALVVHAALLQAGLWALLVTYVAVESPSGFGVVTSLVLLGAATSLGVVAFRRRGDLRRAMAMGTWHLALTPAALLALAASPLPLWAQAVAVVAFVAPPVLHGRALRRLDFDLPSTVSPPATVRTTVRQRLQVLTAMTRPGTWLAAGGLVVIGASFGEVRVWAGVVAALAVASIVATGNVYNDRCDLVADRLNRPDRPLVAQHIAGTSVDRFVLVAGTSAVVATLGLGTLAAGVACFALLLAFAYSLVLRRWLPTGAPTVALLFATPILYGGWFASEGASHPMWLATALVFVFVLSRECLMGVPDIDGDRRSGYRTVATALGEQWAYRAFRAGLVGVLGLLWLPVLVGSPGGVYVAAVAVFAVVPTTAALIRLGWEPDARRVASALHTSGLVFGGGLVPLFLIGS